MKRGVPVAEWRIGRATAFLALFLSLAQAAAAGEFRLLVEGEAGVRDDGGYGGLQDEELRRGEPLARAGINLQLSYALERLNLALGYFPSYERSLEEDDDDDDRRSVAGTTHRLDFGLVADLAQRLRLDVRERLLSTPNLDLYAPVATPETTAVTRRGDQLSHTLDVALGHDFSRRASLLLGVTHGLRRFEDEDLFDSEELSARIGAGFELARGRRIEAAAGVGQYDYKDRGEADVRTLGLAYAFDLGRSNHLRLEAGAFSVDSTRRSLVPDPEGGTAVAVEERASEEGWRGGAQFAQERRLLRWTLGYSHDISPGAGLGRAAVADNAFLGISVPVGRRLELGLDGNASRQSDVSSRDGEREELTEFAAGTARVSWSFVPAFRLSGGYSRVWQRSEVEPFADLSYARYFLSLAFRIFSTGETPEEPESLGRPTDEEPDDQ